MVTVNNIINFRAAKRLNLNYFQHTKNNKYFDTITVLTHMTVVIILQYVNYQANTLYVSPSSLQTLPLEKLREKVVLESTEVPSILIK